MKSQNAHKCFILARDLSFVILDFVKKKKSDFFLSILIISIIIQL